MSPQDAFTHFREVERSRKSTGGNFSFHTALVTKMWFAEQIMAFMDILEIKLDIDTRYNTWEFFRVSFAKTSANLLELRTLKEQWEKLGKDRFFSFQTGPKHEKHCSIVLKRQ